MVRKKISFNDALVARVKSNIQGKLSTPPLWYGALQRVPPAPTTRRTKLPPPIVFELEDRLRRKYLARNPQARDEPLDLAGGARQAVRRSTVWMFVYEWICAMEDRGLSEADAYDFVEATHAERQRDETHGDVTALSLKWAQMTDESIRTSMQDAVLRRDELPPNWNVTTGSFSSAQPGANVLVRPALSAASAHAASGGPTPTRPREGLDECSADVRELALFADDAVSRKLDELEAELQALLAPDAPTDGSADDDVLAYLEQDISAPADVGTDLYDLKVKRL
jgi:hypothetical protein